MRDLLKDGLSDLLIYKEALNIIIDKYEKLCPSLNHKLSPFDTINQTEIENRKRLTTFQGYLNAVLTAIEVKTVLDMEANNEEQVKLNTNDTTSTKTNNTTEKKEKNNAKGTKKKTR